MKQNSRIIIPSEEIRPFNQEAWAELETIINRIKTKNQKDIVAQIAMRDVRYFETEQHPKQYAQLSNEIKTIRIENPKFELIHRVLGEEELSEFVEHWQEIDGLYCEYLSTFDELADATKNQIDFLKKHKDFLLKNKIEMKYPWQMGIKSLQKRYKLLCEKAEYKPLPERIVPNLPILDDNADPKSQEIFEGTHEFFQLKISNQDGSQFVIAPLESAFRFKIETSEDDYITRLTADVWHNRTDNKYLHYFSIEDYDCADYYGQWIDDVSQSFEKPLTNYTIDIIDTKLEK